MPISVNLNLDPWIAADEKAVLRLCSSAARMDPEEISSIRILKKSVDARQKKIKINLTIEVFTRSEKYEPVLNPFNRNDVTRSREVIIIGGGPAGLFAALRLIELGIRPVIIERGKQVSERKVDVARISREHIIDPDSNYCFGEGGAGTFSDGKLYTRSRKRGDNTRVLELLCHHGAPQSIIYEAHPHLGTDRLPAIISAVRRSILDSGGIIMYGKRVSDILIESRQIRGITIQGGEVLLNPSVILATGHSARDIYGICRNRGINMEMKSFAMGVRVEHPQELIDSIQYHGLNRGEYLPAASYSLVRQVDGRGVYSFCMCPGGFIVPAATSQEEIVVNGMSPSGRNSPYANSGIVVEVRPDDFGEFAGLEVVAGLEYQKDLERKAWIQGGRTQRAPAQRLTDFVNGKNSNSLPSVSYIPGITSSPLHEWLPSTISRRLREGFIQFGKMMKGFMTSDAVILGVESRTSSPVRIPRDSETMEHISIEGLFPCGEGSGYAGGIVPSAVDGMRAAESVARKLSQNKKITLL